MSRNVPVGAVVERPPTIQNFSMHELAKAKRQHDVWSKVIYALESGDESTLPKLPVPLTHFCSSQARSSNP